MIYKGFHHIGLASQNTARSVEFYCAIGGKIVHSFAAGSPDRIITLVELAPGAVVEVIPRAGMSAESDPRWIHICIDTDDCAAAFERALAAGAKERIAPKRGNLGTMEVTNCFVTGPDGEDIEFFQVHNI